MTKLEITGTILGLITAAGGGSVATYFWQKFTRRLDAGSLESRLSLIEKFKKSEISEKPNFENSQDNLESAYFYAMYMDSINQLVRQIHKASKPLGTVFKAAAFFLLSLLGTTIFAVFAIVLFHEEISKGFSIVLFAVALFIFIYCTCSAGIISTEHQVSTSALSNCLLSAQNSAETRAVIKRALESEQFFVKEKRYWKKIRILDLYRPMKLEEVREVLPHEAADGEQPSGAERKS